MKLYYRSFGDGHPLIILHGLFGTLDNWHTIGKKLSDAFRVYMIDQRNHGRSPHHDSHTHDDLANDIYIFMHEQSIDTAHILGHSMGGTAAMQLTAHRPEMVNSLIVVDMAPRNYTPRHDMLFKAFDAVEPPDYPRRKDIEEALKHYIPERAVRQYILKNLMRDGENGYKWKFNLKAIRENYRSIITGPDIEGTVANPTLFIKGEKSSYISGEDVERIRQMFTNSRIETVPGAGHWVHSDAPDRFLRLVRNFLTGKD
jgi:esterase